MASDTDSTSTPIPSQSDDNASTEATTPVKTCNEESTKAEEPTPTESEMTTTTTTSECDATSNFTTTTSTTQTAKESCVKNDQVKDLTKIRLLVLNIPYDLKWQDLKDLFKERVGSEMCFVEIYEGLDGKSIGTGVIEVKGRDLADKTISMLHKTELRGRQLVVREEKEKDRQLYQRYGVFGDHLQQLGDNKHGQFYSNNNLLDSLGIDFDCLSNQVFIANLDYSVTVKKIKDVFLMAGTILQVDLKMDKAGSSRGLATVCYENVVEAIQAIAMFNGQYLYDRPMNVRMDRLGEALHQHVPPVMPAGLKGVGPGLGPSGQPLLNIGHVANILVLNNIMNASSTGKLMSVCLNNNNKSRPTSTGGLPQYSYNNNGNNTAYNHYNNTYNPAYNSYNQYTNNPFYNLSQLNGFRFSLSNNNYMLRPPFYHQPFTHPPPTKTDVTTVVVKNLPYSISWQVLKEKFREAGDVQYAEVKMEGGRSKGVGTVRYTLVEAAKKAVALFNGSKMEGRSIEVKGNF